MERFQMNNDKLTLSSIIGMGVLATSLVLGTEIPTYATMLEPELQINSENSREIVSDDYPDYLRNTALFSFQYDRIKIGMYSDENEDIYEDDYPDIEMIEIPVVKKMVFQFNKPVEMEFS